MERMMTMTTRLKFAGTSADEGFTEIFWKPLNLKARGNVLEDRTLVRQELRDTEVRGPGSLALEPSAQGLPMKGLPATKRPVAASAHAGRALEGFVEQDALSEMLAEMSLSTLLYYVLAGEGTDKDESS
jgi:hypothetical protein